ncbi:MAG: hypothetical protein IT495_19370, partial [Gammaproteobacteria bacterium]|nr:hypothetical protein [Gammaproteobacteria bacterium]
QLYYQIGLIGRRDLPFAPDPRGGFEMTLLRMIAFRPGASPGAGERGQGRSRATPGPGTAARSPVPATAAVRAAAGAMPAATGDVSAGAGGAPPATLSAAQWAALVDELDVAGLVRELASNCVFAGCVDGVFRLLLDPRCAQLRNARQERRLEQSLRVHFGSQLRLAIEVADAPAADTPMARQTRRAGELDSAAAQAIAEDPNVQAICARFDGRVESTRARTDPQSNRG